MSEASITHAEEEIIMFVILTYDVNVKRVAKVRKTCIRYLTWVQNSVFEGSITDARLSRLKKDLYKLIDVEKDNIRIYRLDNIRYSTLEVVGKVVDSDTII